MSKRNTRGMRWRWFGGALALVGAILIVASLFYGAESEAQSERTSSPSAAAVSSLAELRANNLLIRDYGEALKRAAGGGIPPLARTRAIQAAKALPALGGAGTWTFIGPDMITNGQGMSAVSSCNKVPRISVSGRVTALGFGKNPSTIYLGTALGGLWISTDSAGTWQPLLDQQPSMAVGALAVVPGAPDTIYVGTGEGNNGCDNEFGQGILKSTDGGASWEQLAADTFDRLTFTKLSVDPLDPNVLYAATSYGLADSQSNACSSVTTGRSGVYKSTDGGASWISRSGKGGLPNGGGASAFDGSAYDVAVNPAPTFAGPFSGIIFDSGGDSCQGAATPPGQATLTAFNPANLTDPNPFKIQVHPSPTGGYDITGTIQIKQDPPSGSFPAGCGTGTNPPCGICDDYGTTKGLPFDVPYQCNGHVKDLNGSPTDFFNCFGGSEVGSAPQMVLKGNFSGDAFNGTLEIDNIICDINCAQDFLGPEAVTFKLVPEVFAGIGGASGGLFKSTDAGITWTKAPTVSTGRRFAIDFSPDGGTMYVANTTLPNANNTSFFNAIYRSTDLGGTFASPGGSPTNACFPEQIGFYALALAVDPANAQHVYLGLSGLYSSNDGGKTFNFIGAGTHADQHVLKTVQGGKLYAGNDGGLFSSTDGGGTWAALNKGLGITQFYGIGLDSSATNITGGTQDNGTDSTTVGTLTWAHSDDGDGGFALIDQNDPTIYFDEHFNLSLDRSGNSGALGSYTPISPGGASMDPIQFYAPFTADPSNPERVLIGTNRLWESCHLQVIAPNFACNGATGLSPDWSAISNDLTGGCTNGFCDITDIAIAPANPQVLYVVTATDGTIGPLAWRSTSGTTIPASFTPITPAGLGKRALTSVAVSPVDAATVVVTAGGFTNTGTAAGHVFLSSDMGKSWSDIGATLTVTVPGGAVLPLDIPVETAAFDPDSPSAGLFIGTDIGVFHTADRGGSWTEVNLGMLPNVPVYQLRAAGGKLFAATHGRGVWSFAPAPTPTASASMTPTATPTATHTATPTPTHTATPSDTPTATPTETPTESPTETPSETATQTPEPTPTPVAAGPFISSIPSTILVGSSFVIDGSGFTNGSVINFFVATSNGPLNAGPLTPSNKTPTALTVVVPATITLGQGFVALQVVNTDQGFVSSNLANALLEGSPGAGIPSITSINGVGLASSSSNPSFATDNVETVVAQGTVVTIGGAGFDTTNGVAVDLFCACTGGKVGPFFISPGPSLSASQIKFTVPAKGLTNSPATGPGSFVVSNAGALKNYAKKSNAVSVPIGARISVLSVSQVASTITVHGTGFSTLTVINFFNKQGAMVVNLGGLSGSTPNIPLNVINDTTFQFNKPAGSVAGPAYVQALNPPFVQFTSSGNDPGGAFTLF